MTMSARESGVWKPQGPLGYPPSDSSKSSQKVQDLLRACNDRYSCNGLKRYLSEEHWTVRDDEDEKEEAERGSRQIKHCRLPSDTKVSTQPSSQSSPVLPTTASAATCMFSPYLAQPRVRPEAKQTDGIAARHTQVNEPPNRSALNRRFRRTHPPPHPANDRK